MVDKDGRGVLDVKDLGEDWDVAYVEPGDYVVKNGPIDLKRHRLLSVRSGTTMSFIDAMSMKYEYKWQIYLPS